MGDQGDEPYTPRQAAAIAGGSAAVTVLGGLALWAGDGWLGWLGAPVFFLGFLMTLGSVQGWYETRHPNAPRRTRVFASAFLTAFFGLAAVFFGWAFFAPDTGCSDCATPMGRAVGVGFQLLLLGLAAAGLRQIFKDFRAARR